MKRNLIITGLPGAGKTTLIRTVVHETGHLRPLGFYTEEIREAGVRKGFALIGIDGTRSILSHENIKSSFRVGKYGVDIDEFERFIELIPFRDRSANLIIVDEIGKMECLSKIFIDLMMELLYSDKLLVATVALNGTGLIAHVKRRPDIELIEVTKGNRSHLPSYLVHHVLMTCRT